MSHKHNKKGIIDKELLDKLKGLPDLFYQQDLDELSQPDLLAVMEALDDAADHINEYLTDEQFSINFNYLPGDPNKVQ